MTLKPSLVRPLTEGKANEWADSCFLCLGLCTTSGASSQWFLEMKLRRALVSFLLLWVRCSLHMLCNLVTWLVYVASQSPVLAHFFFEHFLQFLITFSVMSVEIWDLNACSFHPSLAKDEEKNITA